VGALIWGRLALVVRKESNFDPVLCGLSLLISRGLSLVLINTFWPAITAADRFGAPGRWPMFQGSCRSSEYISGLLMSRTTSGDPSGANPPRPPSEKESANGLEARKSLELSISNPYPPISVIICEQIIKSHILTVPRPSHVAHSSDICCPLAPILAGEIKKHQFGATLPEGNDVVSVG
jgi:hypothetical protein